MDILRQREWNDDQLKAAGFQHYEPVKRLVMAKLLFDTKDIDIQVETITGRIGDFLCYSPGKTVHANPDEYDHWPVRRDIFFKTYKPWPKEGWEPNDAEKHLMELGCLPYYKDQGVWAQRLHKGRQVQSLESPQPVEIPAGRWLLIGSKGEPYSTTNDEFRKRYIVPQDSVKEKMYWATVSSLANRNTTDSSS